MRGVLLRVPFETLRGAGEPLLGGTEVLLADLLDAGLHLLHLFLGVGIGDLEVLQVVEEAANLLIEAVGRAVDPAADLALNHLGVLELVAVDGIGLLGLGDRPERVLDGGDGLLLHREDRAVSSRISRRASSSSRRMSSSERIAQADLAALAQVRALQVVEVAGLGVERDDRAGRQVQRGEVPLVTDLLVLDRPGWPRSPSGASQRGSATSCVGSEPAGGDLVEQAGRLDAEIVGDREDDRDHSPWPARRGRAPARRS